MTLSPFAVTSRAPVFVNFAVTENGLPICTDVGGFSSWMSVTVAVNGHVKTSPRVDVKAGVTTPVDATANWAQ